MNNIAIESSGTKETRGPWLVVRDGKTVTSSYDYRDMVDAEYLLSHPVTGSWAEQLNRLLAPPPVHVDDPPERCDNCDSMGWARLWAGSCNLCQGS